MNVYPVIMAGGAGTRFWPLSRRSRPKQFLSLGNGKSLFRRTVDRVSSVFPKENIRVVAPDQFREQILEESPGLTREAIVREPVPRDTAPCIGLAAMEVRAEDPEAAMITLPSDHYIPDQSEFRETMETATEVLEEKPDTMICFGITPDRPETGYGYIQCGDGHSVYNGRSVFEVRKFTEKPDRDRAVSFLDQGGYYWNSGMFGWRVETVLNALSNYSNDVYQGLTNYREARSSGATEEELEEVFRGIPEVSIDYAVMEDAEEVVVLEANFRWEDMGTLDSLRELFGTGDRGNVLSERATVVDTEDSILFSEEDDHLLAGLGLRDMVVVHTGDSTLVCPSDRVQDVKKLVRKLEEEGNTGVL